MLDAEDWVLLVCTFFSLKSTSTVLHAKRLLSCEIHSESCVNFKYKQQGGLIVLGDSDLTGTCISVLQSFQTPVRPSFKGSIQAKKIFTLLPKWPFFPPIGPKGPQLIVSSPPSSTHIHSFLFFLLFPSFRDPGGRRQSSWRNHQRWPCLGKKLRRRARRRPSVQTALPGRRSGGRTRRLEPSTWCQRPSGAGQKCELR